VFVQKGYGPGSFNFKHTWVATDKLVFDSLAQYTGGGFSLIEQPGTEGVQGLVNRDTNFASRGLYTTHVDYIRPTTEIKTDSSYFFSNLMGGDHTTKFGVRYRNTPYSTYSMANGGAFARVSTRYNNPGLNPRPGSACPEGLGCVLGPDRAQVYREGNTQTGQFTYGAYFQDNYTRGRLRLNLGVRWDYQNDEARAGCVGENPLLPSLLPGQCFEGADRNVNYSDVSPRISATYDLLGTGKTVVKGGFAQYYGQGVGLSSSLSLLGSVTITFQNTTSRTCWNDANGDFFVDANELNLTNPACTQYPSTFDPTTALRNTSPDTVDPNLRNDRITEFTAGIDHELLPNFAVGVNYIRRDFDRFNANIRVGETEDMWLRREWTEQDFLNEGLDPPSQFGLPTTGWIYYEFDPNVVRPEAVYNRSNVNEKRHYNGVDFTVTKRFADRWMANLAATVQTNVTDRDFCVYRNNEYDCTNSDKSVGLNTGTLFLVKLNGMYALPGGWNASANLQIKQGQNRSIGFDGPQTRSGGLNSSGTSLLTLPNSAVTFQAYEYGTNREPLEHLLDAQVTKSFDLRGGKNRLSLIFSVFNVLNANTVRGLRNDLNNTNFGEITSILSPRIGRIQASITF
jgi:hypothetical protein